MGIQIPRLNRWSIELADNITFLHIKGKNECVGRCYLQVENIKYLQRTIGEPQKTLAISNT